MIFLPSVETEPYELTVPLADDAALNLHRWGAVSIFHGLPSDRVNAITEDDKGLLWFGTDNGLVRYDGRNVDAVAGENSLPSRRILALKHDARGSLWIGTDDGAARFRDGRLEQLSETRGRTVTAIAASPQNEIAIVTANGEIIFYQETTEVDLSSERTAASRLRATRLDRNSHLLLKSPNRPDQTLPLTAIGWNQPDEASGRGWVIGSSGRGALINTEKEIREVATKSLRPFFVSSVFIDGANTWLGEQASRQVGGLWLLKNGVLSKPPLNTGAITALHGGKGELWVGTNTHGAFLLRPENDNARLIEHLTFENTVGGLRSNQINTIFRDREGVVWFGTDRGVCRYDRDGFRASNVSDNRQSNFVRSILHTSSGETFCGTNNGLFKLAPNPNDADFGTWTEIAELQGRSIYALHEDDRGAVWIGANSGLFIRSKDSPVFSQVPTVPETTIDIAGENESEPSSENSTNPQPRESVRAMASFRGQVYAAIFERGVEKIEVNQDGVKRVNVLNEPAARRAICFAVEGDKALWFGSSEGELRRFDGSQTKSFILPKKESTATSDRSVRAVQIGGSRIWIGSSQGLYVYEGDAIREVMSGVDVRAMLVTFDASKRETVWCATQNAGLIKLIPDEDLSIRFDTEQGLASQQLFALASNNTDIWIGSNRGVARHRPSSVEPHLQVNRLVADQIYPPEYLTAELSLPHRQQNFLLEVTGLSSRTFPSQFQYEFSLQTRNGRKLKNIQTRDPQFAVEGLKSGGYVIVARAISRDLVYSAPLTVRLRIRNAPFPWTTLLLTSLLGVAVVAAIWAFRQQLRLSRANRALEETNVELHETRLRLANETESERSRIARDLHDQTLSDLRHLLVLTDQLTAPKVEDHTPTPTLLRREIESISNEIRHICEDLSPSVLENIGFLPSLEWALSDAVAHLAAEEKFDYEFLCEPEMEDRLQLSHIEKIQLYRIVQEALNNICRHAKAKRVKMSVRTENMKDLMIKIEDDGVGFNGLMMNKTGHGIANIRSRANLIGAEVVWGDANPGCRFEVRKPDCVKSDF